MVAYDSPHQQRAVSRAGAGGMLEQLRELSGADEGTALNAARTASRHAQDG